MPLQNHIHLGIPGNETADPEEAPEFMFKVVSPGGYTRIPEFLGSIDRSITGNLLTYTVPGSGGAPLQLVNYELRLKVNSTSEGGYGDLDDLMELNGRRVNFVDINHVADGADHTTAIRSVFLSLGPISDEEPGLQFFYVNVQLTDAYTT